ncbi:hypothetical protein [Streptomyces cucumeris]|uniref:hypothetical protein n=1 Tax=Streptomyces cucumeris TaxID=2962890 RepID=UPI003EBF6F49
MKADAVPGTRRSARLLIGVGVMATAPAALAGWVDWAEQQEPGPAGILAWTTSARC